MRGWGHNPEDSNTAEDLYDNIKDDVNEKGANFNTRIISALKSAIESRDPNLIYATIGTIRMFERKEKYGKIKQDAVRPFEKKRKYGQISQPVWQLVYMGLVYCLNNQFFIKQWKNEQNFKRTVEALRVQILEKLEPTIAARKITKFIRSAADRNKAAKIIQRHYLEYLYRPDVYVKSELSKPARLRFSQKK
jgi:hypothetical protein